MKKDMEQRLFDMKKVMEDAGAIRKADIERQIDAYECNPSYKYYYKVFYWTLNNHFRAYQSLDAGLVQANLDGQASHKEKLLVGGIHRLVKIGEVLAADIPRANIIFTVLESVIDAAYGAVKENRMERKIIAINGIIRNKFNTEEDCTLDIALIATAMTEARKGHLDSPGSVSIPTRLERGMK